MTSRSVPFALYDAFSDQIFGGSQAAVITQAGDIDQQQRTRLAREIGMPATVFVNDTGPDWVSVQFMSAVMELPMCGHGTICLLTHLLETGIFSLDDDKQLEIELLLPNSRAIVSLEKDRNNRFQVMLDVTPPTFVAPPPNLDQLMPLLGLNLGALNHSLQVETARADFVHLVVPLNGMEAMQSINPDFSGMVKFCNANAIETIVVFCSEVSDPSKRVHVRDFCPAVGVNESAAAGTSNAALSCYLLGNGMLPTEQNPITIEAEQGIELKRPSSIKTVITLCESEIERLQVGGVATRVIDGQIYI